jgi:hypothetical protein
MPTKRPIVAHIGPDVPFDRLALGQDRHGGVITVQPLGGQNVAFDQSINVDRLRSMPSRRQRSLWRFKG